MQVSSTFLQIHISLKQAESRGVKLKKIFSKFTRERDVRFQIETSIYLENGEKFAQKRPLTDSAAPHVAALYENCKYFREKGVTLFTECEPFEDGVRFPFVKGVTYYTQILQAVEDGDRTRFDGLLETYKTLVEESCGKEFAEFETSAEFEAVFGKILELKGKKACRKLDIDLTLDNLILLPNGENRIIDYEWMFDFLVPVEFVYYRAALALYVRNGEGMNAFAGRDELFGKFGLGRKEQEIYGQMNEAFNAYTSGGEKSFHKALKKYAKKSHTLSEWAKQSCSVVQLYISEDASFENAVCLDFEAGEKIDLQIDLKEFKDVRMIRLDPLNVPVTIHDFSFFFTVNGEEKRVEPIGFRHNAMMVYQESYVFAEEDPQIIWDIPEGMKPEKLHITYSIGEQEDGRTLMKAQMEELKAKEKKLSYIEGTKAYRMFLEKKVNAVFGGEN